MKIEEFNNLCDESEKYMEEARKDLQNVDYLDDIRALLENKCITKLEEFLYTVYNGNLQTDRKTVKLSKERQKLFGGYRTTEQVGVGSFLGIVHSFRTTIEYFGKTNYFFRIIPEHISLIINKEKRKVYQEFLDFQIKYVDAFTTLGFKNNNVLISKFKPTGLMIPEPINFFHLNNGSRSKTITVVYKPFEPVEVELTMSYDQIFNGYSDGLHISLYVYTHNNNCVSVFKLNDVTSVDYQLSVGSRFVTQGKRRVTWVSDPFTFTNLSDFLNISGVKNRLKDICNIQTKLENEANELLKKHSMLLLERGVL